MADGLADDFAAETMAVVERYTGFLPQSVADRQVM
jgi:hypothetical protein